MTRIFPHPLLPEPFGYTVRQQRRSRKLSQQELAEAAGISRNYLSQIERGLATNLSWQVRQRLTEVLDLETSPTAAIPTAAMPTAALPTAAIPTAALPTTALPTTALPTAPRPTAANTNRAESDPEPSTASSRAATTESGLQLPPSLIAFAEQTAIPSTDLLMLARLKYRGQQPTTPEKWAELYQVIKATLEA